MMRYKMTSEEVIDLYKKLIHRYGEKQIVVAIEELSELQKELCKSLRGKTNRENIIEEIADVLIMLDQVILYYRLDQQEIQKAVEYKVKRTKERLLEEVNENTK